MVSPQILRCYLYLYYPILNSSRRVSSISCALLQVLRSNRIPSSARKSRRARKFPLFLLLLSVLDSVCYCTNSNTMQGLPTYYLMATNFPAPCVTVNQRGHWLRTGTCFTHVFATCIILTKVGGGSRASQDPPSYVPVNYIVDGINAIKFEAAWIHFLSDVFLAVVVVVTNVA